jgi:hypothetical protein
MDIVLPKEIAYSPSLPALPECISQDVVLAPVGGNSFMPGQLIQFDLVSRGFIDPSSIYIRYQVQLVNANATDTSVIRGTPLYSFFNKLETIFGSTVVESINNYGQVCNMWTNLQYDVAMKYGQQSAFGYNSVSSGLPAVPSLENLDGRQCLAAGGSAAPFNGEVIPLSGPLPCILSGAEKLIPAGLMPNIRLQLTVDSVANAFTTVQPPSSFVLRNVELCYTMIDFAGGVNDLVKNMGDNFYIKSTSFQNLGMTVSPFVGATELVYNLRLASIKSLFALFVMQNTTKCVNGIYDSIDITSSNGELVFNIAGTYYPSRPVSTLNNKAAVLMELKKAVGALHSESYNFAINHIEFNRTDASVSAVSGTTGTTTATAPGKFIFSTNTEKLSTNGALLTGISTQNSPITLRISTGTATTETYTVNVIAMYDALISVDPQNRQAVVKQ